ncbi:hypothetical protein JCM31271_29880 [Halorubrum trueperi]
MITPENSAAFVCKMEDVLDLYHEPYDPRCPVVCFDESNKELHKEVRDPLPARPGAVARYDYTYERNGTRNLFMMSEPLSGWRHVEVTKRRQKEEFAQQMQALVDDHYPDADRIRVVMDNLNTHQAYALYEQFPPKEARRILSRLEFHFTPEHGSWLNMAEIEFSALWTECLDRRIRDAATLRAEVAAWERTRNDDESTIDWQFTTDDARMPC